MTRFIDGPAIGQTLMLKRAPVYLRVVLDSKGKWDALDQLEDTPRPGERLYAYVLNEKPAKAFIDGDKIHGCYPIASYHWLICQPQQSVMLDSERWAKWCESMGMPEHLKDSTAFQTNQGTSDIPLPAAGQPSCKVPPAAD